MYESLAIIYDCFTDDIDYNRWTDEIESKLKAYSDIPVKTITDLACGTGNVSRRLAKRGYKVTGVDISEEMLLRAAENMRCDGVMCNWVRQDISAFQLHKKSDAIICVCDGVNYLTEDGQLEKFIGCCKRGLKPGGMLIFDVSHEDKLRGVLGNNEYFDVREDACFFWQNNVVDNKVKLELNIFLEQDDGRYIRKTESQCQRIYTQEEIEKELTDFEVLEINTVSFDENRRDKRLQFVCRLNEEK